jgi:hypothetical protein
MCFRIIVSNFSAVSLAVLLAACSGGGGGPTGPVDLVPIPNIGSFDPPFFHFCTISEDGEKLLVTVRNQGDGEAAASTTTVEFSTNVPVVVSMPTSAIPGSESVEDLEFDIPAGCFTSDCDFTITVDSGNVISESSETNNIANGRCIG